MREESLWARAVMRPATIEMMATAMMKSNHESTLPVSVLMRVKTGVTRRMKRRMVVKR